MKKILGTLLLLLLAAIVSFGQQDKILQLKEQIVALQNQGDLNFRNFTLCSKITGFTSYVPLPEAAIGRNDELLVYYEPVNLSTNKNQGLYEIWFTQDLIILNDRGEIVQEWKDLLEYHNSTRVPALDVYAQNTLTLGGELPPGKYTFKAVLKDKIKGKTATHTANFQVK